MIEPDFEKSGGLIPAIVQDYESKAVLMLAYMNRQSWIHTMKTGKATFWSRARNELWIKGETSGHFQFIKEVFIDCDLDTVLLLVEQEGGAACHTGHRSCFYRRIKEGEVETVGERIFDPEKVYK